MNFATKSDAQSHELLFFLNTTYCRPKNSHLKNLGPEFVFLVCKYIVYGLHRLINWQTCYWAQSYFDLFETYYT